MKIKRLSIANFLTIGDACLSLDNKGLVLIQGVNEDDTSARSNGAGKSSVPDAVCWALFGETARGESGDAVVNDKVKKNCRVSALIEDGATLYRISRHRKHSEHKNATIVEVSGDAGVSWVDQSKGTEKETQEAIVKILGCSYEVFSAAIYAGQEAMPDIPKATDKQLKLMVEEAAGIDRIESAYVIARAKETAAKQALDLARSGLEGVRARINNEELSLGTTRVRHEEFEAGRPARIAECEAEREAAQNALVQLVPELKALDKGVIEARAAELEAHLMSARSMETELARLRGIVSACASQVSVASSELTRLGNEAKLAKANLDNAHERLREPCSACGKSHDEKDLETLRAHLSAELNKKLMLLRDAKLRDQNARDALAAAEKERDGYAATIPVVHEVVKERSELSDKLVRLSQLSASALNLRNRRDNAAAKIAAINGEANPYAGLIAATEERIKTLQIEREALESSVEAATRHLCVANATVRVLGPAGVRAQILDTVTPFLNERTSEYLGVMSDGNTHAVWSTLSSTTKGELREKFCIEVTNDKGAKSFKGLSGGEKRKVRLATMLALQDLVASRATKPINLWIGDEIDDAMDDAGIERLMAILEKKARDKGTVLVISHNELRDWIDNVAVVTKESSGVSKVEGALNV